MISIVAAYDDACGIGKDNKIPWHCPDDLRFFKELTTNHIIVMGYNTWKSLPIKPLPDRINTIVSTNHFLELGPQWCSHPQVKLWIRLDTIRAVHHLWPDRDIFIIGGASIYKQVLEMDIVDKMYLTNIHGEYDCDTFFPSFDKDEWDVESSGIVKGHNMLWTRSVLAKKG